VITYGVTVGVKTLSVKLNKEAAIKKAEELSKKYPDNAVCVTAKEVIWRNEASEKLLSLILRNKD
jgi:hypothetical protein